MVTSITIPKATLNTITVDGFKVMPDQPITPAVITNGIKLGIKEQINILNERNRNSIQKAIKTNAQNILSFKPVMINAEPSKNVTLLPVKVTL